MKQINQLQKEIQTLFEENLETEISAVDVDLIENGYLDSLRFVHLLAVLEEKYDFVINIDELEFEYFRSVEKIAEFIMQIKETKPKLFKAI